MRATKIRYILLAVFVMLFVSNKNMLADNKVAQVNSPDGGIKFELFLDADAMMCYRVSKNAEIIISNSGLGMQTSVSDFTSGLTFASVTSKAIDETYSLPSGKKSTYYNKCNEITASFSKSGYGLQVVVRAYNEGIAFRYQLEGAGDISVHAERSECKISAIRSLFSQTYSKDYKNITEETDWELLSCGKPRISLPLLAETSAGYVLLSEAMVDGTYAGSQLEVNQETQAFGYKLIGSVTSSLPLKTPWRTVLIGSLTAMTESVMLENLNPPTEMSDLSWIKPGRAAWNYGGEDTSGYLSLANIQQYIDWAKEMEWEYFTLDRGWSNQSRFTLNQVISYAASKGVGVFIWVNQNTLSANKTDLQRVLSGWKSQGVKGLKVDFWEDDSQTMMKKYDLLMQVASEQKLMLNFSSSTKPGGLRRTWPHLLASEAVLGNAYYATNPAVISSQHNINSAIVRTPLGSTDYCPVDFADKNGRILHGTTWAHQLALSVVFESGIQHVNDAPDNIRYNISADFLKNLPAQWDDIKCLEAEPGKQFTIARRKGDDWYVASLTSESRSLEADLSFLTQGRTYHAYIYKDGDCASEILFEYKENLTATDKITLSLNENGGMVMILSPSSNYAKPGYKKYEAESADNIIPFGIATKTAPDNLCSNNQYVAALGKGRSLLFQKVRVPQSGAYPVTFYYMAETNRYAYVKVNGKDESWQEYTFVGTGSETGSAIGIKTILLDLQAGIDNTIEFGNSNDYAPALDRISISGFVDISTGTKSVSEDKLADIYSLDDNIIIKRNTFTRYKIYNMPGQQVAAGEFDGGTESVPVSEKGIYIVRIESDKMHYSKKVIVK